jgi:hypothetical protein
MGCTAQVVDSFDKKHPPTHFLVFISRVQPESAATALGFNSTQELEDFAPFDLGRNEAIGYRTTVGATHHALVDLFYKLFQLCNQSCPLLESYKWRAYSISVTSETHTCSRLQQLQTDPQRVAMARLTKIWGVGRLKVNQLLSRQPWKRDKSLWIEISTLDCCVVMISWKT